MSIDAHQRLQCHSNTSHHIVKNQTWNAAAEKTFNTLKQAFTTVPILHYPDPESPFSEEVDASETGMGAVLCQWFGDPPKLFPVAFFTHKLSPAERNCDIRIRESLAVKLALEK